MLRGARPAPRLLWPGRLGRSLPRFLQRLTPVLPGVAAYHVDDRGGPALVLFLSRADAAAL